MLTLDYLLLPLRLFLFVLVLWLFVLLFLVWVLFCFGAFCLFGWLFLFVYFLNLVFSPYFLHFKIHHQLHILIFYAADHKQVVKL